MKKIYPSFPDDVMRIIWAPQESMVNSISTFISHWGAVINTTIL